MTSLGTTTGGERLLRRARIPDYLTGEARASYLLHVAMRISRERQEESKRGFDPYRSTHMES